MEKLVRIEHIPVVEEENVTAGSHPDDRMLTEEDDEDCIPVVSPKASPQASFDLSIAAELFKEPSKSASKTQLTPLEEIKEEEEEPETLRVTPILQADAIP